MNTAKEIVNTLLRTREVEIHGQRRTVFIFHGTECVSVYCPELELTARGESFERALEIINNPKNSTNTHGAPPPIKQPITNQETRIRPTNTERSAIFSTGEANE